MKVNDNRVIEENRYIKRLKTVICNDSEGISQKCADFICEVLTKKPDSLLCLPAGSSALRTFQVLKERSDSGEVDFNRATFVELDEWLDLEDESENCTAFLFQHFYGPLGIDKSRVRLFDIHSADLEEECRSMDTFITSCGGIDIMLLGLGMNGHLGLNEPGSRFDCYSKVVELDEVTKKIGQKYFSKPMKLSRGITLGMRHVIECRFVILQVGGKAKADIVGRLYKSNPSCMLPGSIMKLIDNSVVVLDRDAAVNVPYIYKYSLENYI